MLKVYPWNLAFSEERMARGGRFGKYGDFKRKAQIRKVRLLKRGCGVPPQLLPSLRRKRVQPVKETGIYGSTGEFRDKEKARECSDTPDGN